MSWKKNMTDKIGLLDVKINSLTEIMFRNLNNKEPASGAAVFVDELKKLEKRITALEILDKYNYHKRSKETATGFSFTAAEVNEINRLAQKLSNVYDLPLSTPVFKPGDLVMRKDGKAWDKDNPDYSANIIDSCYGPSGIYFKVGNKYGIYTHRENELTLAPPKPKPEDIKGYELTGEFRPPKIGEPFYNDEVGGIKVIHTKFGTASEEVARWILRRKERKKVEFEGMLRVSCSENYTIVSFRIEKSSDNLPIGKPCKVTVEYDE